MNLRNKKAHSLLVIGSAVVIIAAMLISAVIFKFGPFSRNELRVHIENVGDMELRSLEVSVTGGRVMLGSLMPGRKAEAVVVPTGESSVKISLIDLLDEEHNFDAGGYFEPGYVGDIWIKMTYAKVVATDFSDVSPY